MHHFHCYSLRLRPGETTRKIQITRGPHLSFVRLLFHMSEEMLDFSREVRGESLGWSVLKWSKNQKLLPPISNLAFSIKQWSNYYNSDIVFFVWKKEKQKAAVYPHDRINLSCITSISGQCESSHTEDHRQQGNRCYPRSRSCRSAHNPIPPQWRR